MRILKTMVATAALAVITSTAFAGGLAPEIVEVEEEMPMAAPSSVNSGLIVMGILAALLIASSSGGSDEAAAEEPAAEEPPVVN